MTKERVVWIDLLKAFGILLVMLGHIYQKNDMLYHWIYSFHVPLFFFLSGIFFVKADNFRVFIIKRWNTLILPYFVFYFITFAYWALVERNMRAEAGGVVAEWWRPVGGAILGLSEFNLMPHNNPLWFIPTLFSIEILAFGTRKFNQVEKAVLACLFLLSFAWCRHLEIILPWEFVLAMEGYMFYWLGNIMFALSESKYKMLLLFGAVLIYSSIIFFNGGFAPNFTFPQSYHLVEMPQYFAIAINSLVICLLIGACVPNIIAGHLRLLQFLGTNTLVILCIHDPVKRVLIFLYSRIWGLSIETVRSNIFHSLLVLMILVVCLIPLIHIYNRWGKPIVNKLAIRS